MDASEKLMSKQIDSLPSYGFNLLVNYLVDLKVYNLEAAISL